MSIKKVLSIVLLVLFATTSVAFGKTKIVVWHSYRGKERNALDKLKKDFNKENQAIEIELLPIPYDAFADKITAAIPRGKGPDLFIFAQDRVGDWAASGLVEPIDFWVDAKMKAKYLPPTIEALTYDDSLYGLPIAFKMVALFYNTKLIPTPPKTTDEMIAMAKKVTKDGTFGLVYENANFYYQAAWMQGFGGKVFSGKGVPSLDSAKVIESMKFAQRLAHKEGIMPEEISSTLVTTLFNKGKAAMVINGPWFMGEIARNVPYKVAVLPKISGINQPAKPFLTAEGVIMSAKSKHKKEAFEVMKFLTGVKAGVMMATKGRQTAARKEVYDDAKVKKDGLLLTFKRQLKTTIPMPNTPSMLRVWSPATTAMNKIINGKKDPGQAMKTAQQEVKKLVKGARR